MSKWRDRWMSMARLVAGWSTDPNRKVGAVVVDGRQVLLSMGWNGMPRGVREFDHPELPKGRYNTRWERPRKYLFVTHAEGNAIANAAATGRSLIDATIYVTLPPCADCAKLIIQSGIGKVVCPSPDTRDERWAESWEAALLMFTEAETQLYLMGGIAE